MPYLTPEEAQSKLIAAGLFTPETAPSVETLASAIELIESKINTWIGYKLDITEYQENARANSRGVLLLTNYPVTTVLKINQIPMTVSVTPPPTQADEAWSELSFEWSGDRKVNIFVPGAKVRVTYQAGYEPGSPEFKLVGAVILSVLSKIIANAKESGEAETENPAINWWDLNFLNQYQKYVSSLSLPGGLTQTFRIMDGGGQGGAGGGGNQWDELLSPLAPYRRSIMTAMAK